MTVRVRERQICGKCGSGRRCRRIISARTCGLFREPRIRSADAGIAIVNTVGENNVRVSVRIERHSEIFQQIAIAGVAVRSAGRRATQSIQTNRMIVNTGCNLRLRDRRIREKGVRNLGKVNIPNAVGGIRGG